MDNILNWAQVKGELLECLITGIKGCIILVVGWIVARVISKLMSKAMKKGIKKDLLLFLNNLIFYVILTLSTVAALSEIGVDTNSFLTVLGGGALAIGLGLKDQLGQLTAGIVLLIKHPFQIGDLVTLAGVTGKVESIDFFQTTLKTRDNRKIILPNSLAMGSVITNNSGYSHRRIDLPVLISYSDNVSEAKQVLIDTAQEEPLVQEDPPPKVVMSNMKDCGVELILRCWVVSSSYGSVRAILLEKIKENIEKQGCTIPFPQLVLHNKD